MLGSSPSSPRSHRSSCYCSGRANGLSSSSPPSFASLRRNTRSTSSSAASSSIREETMEPASPYSAENEDDIVSVEDLTASAASSPVPEATLNALEQPLNNRPVTDILPPAGEELILKWGHDENTNVLHRYYRQHSTLGPVAKGEELLEGYDATDFSVTDKVRMAIDWDQNHHSPPHTCQPKCMACGNPHIVVSCNGRDHACSAPALCGEHYKSWLFKQHAFSGMKNELCSYNVNLCMEFPSKRDRIFSEEDRQLPNETLLSRYSIRPLILLYVDCFTAEEPNSVSLYSSINNFFTSHNLLPGHGILFFTFRVYCPASFSTKLDQLRAVLEFLFSHAPSWLEAPIIVSFNIHFDGLAHFVLPKPGSSIDCGTLRSYLHLLDQTLIVSRSHPPYVKYFLNTCGMGREALETIATPPQPSFRPLDIASFELLLPVDRVLSNYSQHLEFELFNLFGFKGKTPLAPFQTVFRDCFARTDRLQTHPVYCEPSVTNQKVLVRATFEPLLRATPPSSSVSSASLASSVPISLTSSSQFSLNCHSGFFSPLPPLIGEFPPSPPRFPFAADDSFSDVPVPVPSSPVPSPPPAKKPRTRGKTVEQMQQLLLSSSKDPHRYRYRIALDHLVAAGVLTSRFAAEHSSTSVFLFLPEVNKSRASRSLPPLASLYDPDSSPAASSSPVPDPSSAPAP